VSWKLRTRTLTTEDHTLVMGVLNVTPDSFSDGGDRRAPGAAIAAGSAMAAAGADIVDVGGESTRPGSDPTDAGEEARRVLPVVSELARRGIVVSVDTQKPEVASAALEAGAEIINDINGLRSPGMLEVCASHGAAVVAMHMQGTPKTMQLAPEYDDVVGDVAAYLAGRAEAAESAGIEPGRICLDPGVGFGKTFEQNLTLLAGLDRIVAIGKPVLVGTSRKGFLGEILRRAGRETAPRERDVATAATVAGVIAAGAAIVRVHDVETGLEAARTTDAIVRAAEGR
jgi:dihydropteroate synthase